MESGRERRGEETGSAHLKWALPGLKKASVEKSFDSDAKYV